MTALSRGPSLWSSQVETTSSKTIVAKPRLGEFKIVEEYTLDEQNSSFKKLAVVRPTPVETSSCSEQSSVVADLSVPAKEYLKAPVVPPTPSPANDKQTGPKVVYAANNTDFYVGTTPSAPKREPALEMVSPDSYQWKKKLCVSVRKLSDFEISYWTGENNQDSDELPIKLETNPDKLSPSTSMLISTCSCSHLKEEPSTDAIKPESPGDQTTEKLLAHAKLLIKCVSKALGTSDVLKTKSNTVVLGPAPTARKDSVQPSTSRRGQVCVETRSDKKPIKCQMCEYTCTSVTALSNHHQNDHGILKCDVCGKAFASKPSLDKHMYVHMNTMTFVCEECGQGFPFQSRLLQHKITHSTESRFVCNQGSCNKSFKNKGDLTRHVGTHADKWYFCAHCSYKNKDKRNRDTHSRVHENEGEERYHCEKCGKRMRFSTQMKCHRETGCDLSTFHV